MLYTDKYVPQKIEELLGNEDARMQIKQWLLQWLSGKRRKALLIHGPTGVGKTSITYTLQKEFDLEILEMNASELRNRNRVERITGGAALAGSLFGKMKLILIDDVDMLAGRTDSGGSPAIAAFLKECPCPIILTASDIWDKKLAPIRNECEAIQFKKINKLSIKKFIDGVSKSEKLGLSAEQISAISDNAEGDVRAALNDLQSLGPSARDHEKDIFNLIRDIFKAESYEKAKEAVRGDIDYELIKLWVDENIPNEYETTGEIAHAYNSLSKADIFDGRIKKSKWQLLKYSIDLSTVGVSLAKNQVYRKFTKYSFPSFLRNMSRSVERRAMLKGIGLKLGARLHTSWRDGTSYIPIIKEFAATNPDSVMQFYDLDCRKQKIC
ncbi:replication factor C large subunit [Candidatus Micrarchaeota archaeon]|nr:replication factor C large subunit [Candidatus Micrarchaeota archaeon]